MTRTATLFPDEEGDERMSRNNGYRNINKKNKRGFTPDIKPEISTKLDIYCKINGINKTYLVNKILNKWLDEKFQALREEL